MRAKRQPKRAHLRTRKHSRQHFDDVLEAVDIVVVQNDSVRRLGRHARARVHVDGWSANVDGVSLPVLEGIQPRQAAGYLASHLIVFWR